MDDPEMTQWELDEQAKWDKMVETIKKAPQLFGPVLDELVEKDVKERDEFIDDNPWNPEPTYEVPGMEFE